MEHPGTAGPHQRTDWITGHMPTTPGLRKACLIGHHGTVSRMPHASLRIITTVSIEVVDTVTVVETQSVPAAERAAKWAPRLKTIIRWVPPILSGFMSLARSVVNSLR